MYVDPNGNFVLSAIIVGALVGGILAFATSVFAQALDNDGDFSKVNYGEAFYDFAFGAINGALAASGIGVGLSIVLGAALGGASSIGKDLIFNDGQIDWGKAAYSALIGGLAGWIAGEGANNIKAGMQVTKYINSRNILNSTVANGTKGAIARQTAAMNVHATKLAISAVRYFLSHSFSSVAGWAVCY